MHIALLMNQTIITISQSVSVFFIGLTLKILFKFHVLVS